MNSHDDDICVGSISTVELVKMRKKIESLTVENERLRAALTHPFLNQVLGDLEDADADDKTWEVAKSWMDYRNEVMKGA